MMITEEFHCNGRKYIKVGDNFEPIKGISMIDGHAVELADNAPEPIVYGYREYKFKDVGDNDLFYDVIDREVYEVPKPTPIPRYTGTKPLSIIPKADEALKEKCSQPSLYGNIWVKEVSLENIGDMKSGHRHEFDHVHHLVRGKAIISVYDDNGKVLVREEVTAPKWLMVPKEHFHDIKALEPNTLGYCMQAVRDTDGDVVSTAFTPDNISDLELSFK